MSSSGQAVAHESRERTAAYLIGGLAGGLLLAAVAHARWAGIAGPSAAIALLPFALALLTGAAKTTTA